MRLSARNPLLRAAYWLKGKRPDKIDLLDLVFNLFHIATLTFIAIVPIPLALIVDLGSKTGDDGVWPIMLSIFCGLQFLLLLSIVIAILMDFKVHMNNLFNKRISETARSIRTKYCPIIEITEPQQNPPSLKTSTRRTNLR